MIRPCVGDGLIYARSFRNYFLNITNDYEQYLANLQSHRLANRLIKDTCAFPSECKTENTPYFTTKTSQLHKRSLKLQKGSTQPMVLVCTWLLDDYSSMQYFGEDQSRNARLAWFFCFVLTKPLKTTNSRRFLH